MIFHVFHATDMTVQTLDRVVQLRKSHVKTSLAAFGKERQNKGIHSCCKIFNLFNTQSCWESQGT